MMPVLLPPPHLAMAEHEAESATRVGRAHQRATEAVSIFTLGVPSESLNCTVLAVADAQDWAERGEKASAAAVDALEDRLTGWATRIDVTSHAWQKPVADALISAFEHANEKVRALLDGPTVQPGQGVALTAAVVLGNWLCVGHVGDCRAYRLAKNELAQITADHGRLLSRPNQGALPTIRALGLAPHVMPAIRFFRLSAGNVVLVCSNSLCRHLDGKALARLMASRRPIAEIAQDLVGAAARRGGADDMSVCLARVAQLPARLLPDPAGQASAEQVAESATLPRFRARSVSPWKSRGLGVVLGGLVFAGASAGGWRLWQARRPAVIPAPAIDTMPQLRSVSEASVQPPPAPPVQRPDTVSVTTPVRPPAPAKPRAVTPPAASVNNDAIIRARILAEIQQRAADSAAQQKRLDDQRISDSLAAVRKAEAAAQQERERHEAQVRADEQTAAAAAAAAAQKRAHDLKLAAGQNALSSWLNSLVNAANARQASAPVLAAGPRGFADFVDKKQPKLSEAKLLGTTVTEESGQATAEWVAKWRTDFGTATSRTMKAAATIIPDRDGWRLESWRITEGAP
jgi:protein phosphatase